MALKQPREPLKFAVPIFLTTLDHHGARRVPHDNLIGPKGRSAQYPHRVIMGQHQMADGLVCDRAHTIDDLLGKAGGRLCLDDHHAVIADDNA